MNKGITGTAYVSENLENRPWLAVRSRFFVFFPGCKESCRDLGPASTKRLCLTLNRI